MTTSAKKTKKKKKTTTWKTGKPNHMSTIIGLTGGIGSGKSSVARIWGTEGIPVVDADLIAREITEPGTACLAQILAMWPVSNKGGILDRRALADIVFNDPVELRKLNKLTHPLIEARAQDLIQSFSKGHAFVVFDNPLLFGTGRPHPRPNGVGACSPEVQVQRVMKRYSCTESEAYLRVNAQFPLEVKLRGADYVINSTGTKDELGMQALQVLKTITEKA